MIGNGAGTVSIVLCLMQHIADAGGTVQQRELSVAVKMRELWHLLV
jgi:hypothetical protein